MNISCMLSFINLGFNSCYLFFACMFFVFLMLLLVLFFSLFPFFMVVICYYAVSHLEKYSPKRNDRLIYPCILQLKRNFVLLHFSLHF